MSPEKVGLPLGSRRRTPGLRREEIAVLAGLSPSWYTYLEQGREIRPSSEVLDSLARVFELTATERRYLHLLAGGPSPGCREPVPEEPPDALLRRLVTGRAGDVPMFATDPCMDLVVWNEATTRWYDDFGVLPRGRRNLLWWVFAAPAARERLPQWEDEARDLMARFRLANVTRLRERRYQYLVTSLRRVSPEFCDWWPEHDVRENQSRLRQFRLADGQIESLYVVVLQTADKVNSVALHLPVE
jgi:transcriptional regulator with XRE-family HTH domain